VIVVGQTPPELARAFEEAFLAGNRAWNEGDIEQAYAALPEDLDYSLARDWPNARPLHGRAEVVAFFTDFNEMFPSVETTSPEIIPVDEQTIVTGFHLTGTGRSSGAEVEMDIWQVWTITDQLVPLRVVEFHDRETALRAARGEAGGTGG
jgi:ketosteroid isomerase-like protein